ncbi:amino acid permease C-terminal domain-containing protein, partial [Acidisphaera sp. L21]|uniref:amino acid permease C-terminal domain-containing protein n=1 Tax=Acidisphaera sp. L21 TaxID=1641851 RepID=UPI002342E363
LVLRMREPDQSRDFRAPGGPVVPLLGVAICLLMMVSLPGTTWLRLAAWFVLGLAVYAAYSHRRAMAVRTAAAAEPKLPRA